MTIHQSLLKDKRRNQLLVRLRQKHGLSVRSMAAELGMSSNAISLIETGKRNVSTAFINKLLAKKWISDAEAHKLVLAIVERTIKHPGGAA